MTQLEGKVGLTHANYTLKRQFVRFKVFYLFDVPFDAEVIYFENFVFLILKLIIKITAINTYIYLNHY